MAVRGVRGGDPVAVEEADHATLEDDRGRDVLAPFHDAGERVAPGLLGAVGLVDDDGPAAAQHLRLDERIAEPHGRLLQRRERLRGVAGALAAVDGLRDEQAVVDAAEHAAVERERAARLGRRAVDDLAHGAGVGEPVGGVVDGLEDPQALEALLDVGGGQRVLVGRGAHRLRARGGIGSRPPPPAPPLPGSRAERASSFALAVISSR